MDGLMKKHLGLVGYLILCLTFVRGAVAQDTYQLAGKGLGPVVPAIGDLNNDPSDGLETAVTTPDGTLQVMRANGTLAWSVRMPNVSCALAPATDRMASSPVIGELYGDGVKYVIAGYGGLGARDCDGGVVAYRGSDGRRAWVFSTKRFGVQKKFHEPYHAVYGTPAVGDVNGDGKLEVGFGSFDRHIYLLNANGSVRWYAVAADSVFSSPSFVDVDDDGKKEMIISTDITLNERLRPPTPNGGYVYALRAGIVTRAGTKFNFRDPRLQVWRAEFDQGMDASPAVGNVMTRNPGLEVVVGAGCFFPQGAGERRGKWFKVLSARTGKVLRTLRVTACTRTGPTLADLDQDGVLDVIGTVSGARIYSGDGTSHVVAWSPNKNKVLWDVEPRAGTRSDLYGGHYGRKPIVFDLSGDGLPEILVTYSTDVVVFNSAGEQLTCDSNPCNKPLLRTGATVKGGVAIADTDGDGAHDLSVAGNISGVPHLFRWVNPFS